VLGRVFLNTFSQDFRIGIHKEDPNPEYDPYINNPKIVNTPIPPTRAIAHNGMRRLVSAMFFYYVYMLKNCDQLKK
jgi:hypothetical protein